MRFLGIKNVFTLTSYFNLTSYKILMNYTEKWVFPQSCKHCGNCCHAGKSLTAETSVITVTKQSPQTTRGQDLSSDATKDTQVTLHVQLIPCHDIEPFRTSWLVVECWMPTVMQIMPMFCCCFQSWRLAYAHWCWHRLTDLGIGSLILEYAHWSCGLFVLSRN